MANESGVAGWRASNLRAAKAAFKARGGALDTDFALACALTPSALSALASGKRPLGASLARRIEARLGLTAGELDCPPLGVVAQSQEELDFLRKASELFRRARSKRILA